MQKISFKKNKLHFVFRNPTYSLIGLTFEYKISNVLENSTNDGYFYHATYDQSSKTINFNIRFIVDNQEYVCVKIPDRFQDLIHSWYSVSKKHHDKLLSMEKTLKEKRQKQVLDFLLGWNQS